MKEKRNSFTLIELLVVIAIIGILAGILIVSVSSAANSANDARRKADINQLVKAVTIIKTEDGSLPAETNANCKLGSPTSAENCSGIQARLATNGATISRDPVTEEYYTYNRVSAEEFTIKGVMSDSNVYTYNSAGSNYYVNSVSPCVSSGVLICTESTSGSYTINKLTLSSNTTTSISWIAPMGVNSVEYLVVAGGGGGGSTATNTYGAGGGGAGGMRAASGLSVTPGNTYTITVGAGGASMTNGSDSSFGSIVAVGGGHGGKGNAAPYGGTSGGSGGGSSYNLAVGAGTAGQGNAGGTGSYGGDYARGGSGGGAGAAGSNTVAGVGLQSSITGTATYYAGGGSGGGRANNYPSGLLVVSGALGGGGNGSQSGVGGAGTNGLGGGGGGAGNGAGGTGGSGVVILKYLTP